MVTDGDVGRVAAVLLDREQRPNTRLPIANPCKCTGRQTRFLEVHLSSSSWTDLRGRRSLGGDRLSRLEQIQMLRAGNHEGERSLRRLLATLGMAGLLLAATAGPALADGPTPTNTPRQICPTTSGAFIDLGGLANVCLLPTAATEADIRQAELLCAQRGGQLFLAVGDIAYACVLPGGTSLIGPLDTGATVPGVVAGPDRLLNTLLGTSNSSTGLLRGPGGLGLGGLPLPNPVIATGVVGNGLLTGPSLLGLFPIRVS